MGRARLFKAAVLGLGIFGAAAAFQATTTGLVGYWNFDETTGIQANDTSPDATVTNGAHTNGPVIVQGAANLPPAFALTNVACLDFDGIDDFVNLGNSLDLLQATAGATLACWVRLDTLKDCAAISISVGGTPPQGSSRATLEFTPTGQIRGIGRSTDAEAGQIMLSAANEIAIGTWAHVACVIRYDTDAIELYKNGVRLTSAMGTIAFAATTTPNTPSANGALGSGDDGVGIFVDGRLDDVRVYRQALSAADIQRLAAPSPPTGVSATAGPGQVTLTWSAPAGGAQSYNVYWSSSPTGPWTLLGNTTGTTFTDTTGATGQTRYYYITAVGAAESAPSAIVSTAPLPPPPRMGDNDEGLWGDKCSCGSTSPRASPAAALAALAALVLALRRRII